MACENNLFIHFDNLDKKNYFLNLFENSDKLFQTLIPLNGTKLECYGTDSDVYLEYITFDICDTNVISLVFFTNENPCIPFCKKVCGYYGVNIELVYFNEESNFSGKFCIHLQQITKNELYNYWQGLYILHTDLFWEITHLLLATNTSNSFMEFLQDKNLNLLQKDFMELKYKFDEMILFEQFKKLM